MATETHHGRGYVYCLHYHIVWCVKYRYKVLTPAIVEDLVQILKKIANDNEFKILKFNTDQDHIHILIPGIMKAIKGVSARLLIKKHGDALRKKLWGGHLWNPSYFITTVFENTEAQVREYIKSQGEKD